MSTAAPGSGPDGLVYDGCSDDSDPDFDPDGQDSDGSSPARRQKRRRKSLRLPAGGAGAARQRKRRPVGGARLRLDSSFGAADPANPLARWLHDPPRDPPGDKAHDDAWRRDDAAAEPPRDLPGDEAPEAGMGPGDLGAGSSSEDMDGEEEVDKEEQEGALSDLSDGSDDCSQPSFRAADALFPDAWPAQEGAPAPGEEGFAAYAYREIRARAGGPRPPGDCPPLQPHQRAVAYLLHPRSPVERLLVDQPTGAGKTREMITVLDHLFFDKRPKVPIFPKAAVCRNFYEELLRWPSNYRDFFCCMNPRCARLAAGVGEDGDWKPRRRDRWSLAGLDEATLRVLCEQLRATLEMKSAIACGRFRCGFRRDFRAAHPNEPLLCAPLRALSYASAGGHHTKLGRDGKPISALLKFGYTPGETIYSGKIVLLDEAHNLVRRETKYAGQLGNLRRHLHAASGSVIAGFTGTPIPDDPRSGEQLLAVLKGSAAAERSHEGFFASMARKRPPLFPRTLPRGLPDAPLSAALRSQLCRTVPLRGEALKAYALKRAAGLPARKLQAYCNLASHCCTFHSGRKAAMLARPADWMPKLASIAREVCLRRQKAVVLISRQGGYRAMLAHMQQAAAAAEPPFAVASGEQLAQFNAPSNARGEVLSVLVVDSSQFGEGTSFLNVRWLYLADVPGTAAAFQQQCGRVSRMFGHSGLQAEERSVSLVMPIAVLPGWVRQPLGDWCLRAFCHAAADAQDCVQSARRLLRLLSAAGVTTLEHLKEVVDEADGHVSADPAAGCDGIFALLERWSVLEPEARGDEEGLPEPAGRARKGARYASRFANVSGLVQALQALRRAESSRRLAASLAAGTLAAGTVDETSLESLASHLEAQVPALASLRHAAIPCDAGDDDCGTDSDLGDDADAMDLSAPAAATSEEEASSSEEVLRPVRLGGLGRKRKAGKGKASRLAKARPRPKPRTAKAQPESSEDVQQAALALGAMGIRLEETCLPSEGGEAAPTQLECTQDWISALDAALTSPAKEQGGVPPGEGQAPREHAG